MKICMQTLNEKKQPFFARFLENQDKQTNPDGRVTSSEQQVAEAWITKPWLDMEQTQKYPSDGDEI